MNRQSLKRFVPLAAAVLLSAHMATGPVGAAAQGSGATQVIEILDSQVSPSTVVVRPNTTVIWDNGQFKDVLVNLRSKNPIKRSCADPDESGETNPQLSISPIGKGSLCLSAPGTYYHVTAPQGSLPLGVRPAHGTIIVRN
jgi:hypothetical protein